MNRKRGGELNKVKSAILNMVIIDDRANVKYIFNTSYVKSFL